MLLFCGLFTNTAMGQLTYTWNGSVSSDWANTANWTKSSGTLYPGQGTGDLVVINNNSVPNAPVIASTVPNAVSRVTINNANGTIGGATLTINDGATLTVSTSTVTVVILNGGNF